MPTPIDFNSTANGRNFVNQYNQFLGSGGSGYGTTSVRSLLDFLNNWFGGGFEIQDSGFGAFDQMVNEGTLVKVPRSVNPSGWAKATDLQQAAQAEYMRQYNQSIGFQPGGTGGTGGVTPGGTNPLIDEYTSTGNQTPDKLINDPLINEDPYQGGNTGLDGQSGGGTNVAANGGIGDFFGRMFGGKDQDWVSTLGQLILGMGSGLLSDFSPSNQANRDLMSTMSQLNTARIPQIQAETAGTVQKNRQDDISFKQNLARSNSLNPLRKQGMATVQQMLAGQGPAQQTLNSFRGDTRRTIPNLPSGLFGQMNKQGLA